MDISRLTSEELISLSNSCISELGKRAAPAEEREVVPVLFDSSDVEGVVSDSHDDLSIGKRVEVFDPIDRAYYTGTITAFSDETFDVQYETGNTTGYSVKPHEIVTGVSRDLIRDVRKSNIRMVFPDLLVDVYYPKCGETWWQAVVTGIEETGGVYIRYLGKSLDESWTNHSHKVSRWQLRQTDEYDQIKRVIKRIKTSI